MNNSNTKPECFDVFLCHNREDKPEIRRIADDLIKLGIKPWLDEREINPGESWQSALEKQISTIKSATVFVGESGIGPWQDLEMRAFINEFVDRKCTVIPAILPSAKTTPTLPILLKSRHYVDFRVPNPDPLVQLMWGINGEKPKTQTFFDSGAGEDVTKKVRVADIFLSYDHEDISKAKQLVASLEKQGWSVFWDISSILAGEDFDDVIEKAIDAAKCMIVVWSEASKKSYYVRDEAKKGQKRKILVPILVERIDPPMGFGSIHTENFVAWNGKLNSDEFHKLQRAVARLVGSGTGSN